MVRDLNFPIEIIAAPLVRGEDGLALSSRNRYLTEDEHRRALVLSRALRAAVPALKRAGYTAAADIVAAMKQEIAAAGGQVDYVEALDADTLAAPTEATSAILLAVAVYFGTTRLIDNELVQVK